MKNDKKYTFSDIIDFFLILGGLGIGTFLFLVMMAQPRFMLPKPVFFIDILLLFLGSIGTGRLLLRQKQDKIEELESLLPPSHAHHLQSPNHNLTSHSHTHIQQQRISSYEADLEVRFLEALMQKKGKISLVEAVILVRESIDTLIPIIEKLQKRGIIGTEIEENGQIVYVSI